MEGTAPSSCLPGIVWVSPRDCREALLGSRGKEWSDWNVCGKDWGSRRFWVLWDHPMTTAKGTQVRGGSTYTDRVLDTVLGQAWCVWQEQMGARVCSRTTEGLRSVVSLEPWPCLLPFHKCSSIPPHHLTHTATLTHVPHPHTHTYMLSHTANISHTCLHTVHTVHTQMLAP
jgi:hypothetical protein